jgi:hypothetical protein
MVLVPALVLLACLVVAYPPTRVERSFAAFLDSVPGWLAPIWGFAYDLLALWAILLLGAAIVTRRLAVALQALGSIGAAVLVSAVSGRLAVGAWPDADNLLLLQADDSTYPVARVALCTALILTVGPHLVRPLERAGRWILAAGIAGALLAEPAAPGAILVAFAIGFVAAAAIRLAFGTSAGHPETANVLSALAELGVEAQSLEAADRQPAGVFIARGSMPQGGRSSSRSTAATPTTRTCSRRPGARPGTGATARACGSAAPRRSSTRLW